MKSQIYKNMIYVHEIANIVVTIILDCNIIITVIALSIWELLWLCFSRVIISYNTNLRNRTILICYITVFMFFSLFLCIGLIYWDCCYWTVCIYISIFQAMNSVLLILHEHFVVFLLLDHLFFWYFVCFIYYYSEFHSNTQQFFYFMFLRYFSLSISIDI